MRRIGGLLLAIGLLLAGGQNAIADSYLYRWGFNIDGYFQQGIGDQAPASISSPNGLDYSFYEPFGSDRWVGAYSWSTTSGGTHDFVGYLDFEMNESLNSNSNEFATQNNENVKPTNLGWAVDDPMKPSFNIYDSNVLVTADQLDNSNDVEEMGDVSIAFGWQFDLADDEMAIIDLVVSSVIPDFDVFYLSQTDNGSGEKIYFWSTLTITEDQTPVPEPGTLLLLGAGVIGLVGRGRRRRPVEA